MQVYKKYTCVEIFIKRPKMELFLVVERLKPGAILFPLVLVKQINLPLIGEWEVSHINL
jgi:hypothetical protein